MDEQQLLNIFIIKQQVSFFRYLKYNYEYRMNPSILRQLLLHTEAKLYSLYNGNFNFVSTEIFILVFKIFTTPTP